MEIAAKPRRYQGTDFRSILEADWAATLDHYGIQWQYEPGMLTLASGTRYVPDFWLPDLATVIEVKGTSVPRIHKPIELAEETLKHDAIIIIGLSPHSRRMSPYAFNRYLLWRDAAGCESRFTRCAHCHSWQWLRPQLRNPASVYCRRCGQPCQSLLAKPGELRFMTSSPDRPAWMDTL